MVARLVLVLTLLASAAAAHQGYETRVAELTLAIDLRPDDAGLRLERAGLYRKLGRFDEALADLDRAGEGGEVALLRGLVLLDAGRAKDAEAALSRAIAGEDTAAARAARSEARQALGNGAGAIEDCVRAVALDPTPARVLRCGGLLSAAQRQDEAAALYRRALEALGASVIRYRLVDLEVERGRFEDALAVLDGAPATDDRALRRAEVLAAAGRHDAARHAFTAVLDRVDAALARRPSELRRLHRARALLGLGRRADAVAVLAGVVRRAPRLDAARVLLERARP